MAMNVDEVISKAELFAMNFIAKISDKHEQPARKQAYFLDHQEELQKYMGAMQKILTTLDKDDVNAYEGQDNEVLLNRADSVVTKLKDAITAYQKELTIDDSTTEEDTSVALTQETIADAMQNNKTTQEISANMQAIAEQQKVSSQIGYNYALVCDGQINMIAANDKATLNQTINDIANAGSYKSIQLYEMAFKPVQLKKKTVLTV